MSDEKEKQPDVGERRAAANMGSPFRSALLAVFVFYIAAGILNGRALHENASRRPYGAARDIWMAATAPLHWISTATGADRIRASFETILEDKK